MFCRRPLSARLALRDLRQPEIQNLQLPAICEKHIRRLDVAMHNTLGMGRLQSIRHLNRQRQYRLHVHRLSVHSRRQRLPHQQLHHDEMLQLVPLDGMDGADIRMIQ